MSILVTFLIGVCSHLFVVKVCIGSSRSRNKFILRLGLCRKTLKSRVFEYSMEDMNLSKCGRHLNLVHSSLEVSSICYLKLVVHSGNKCEDLI